MSGEEVRKKLVASGYKMITVANAMGIIPQNLQSLFKSDDIKTGSLEKIAEAINKDITFFYDTQSTPVNSKLIESQQRTIENLSETIKNLTSK